MCQVYKRLHELSIFSCLILLRLFVGTTDDFGFAFELRHCLCHFRAGLILDGLEQVLWQAVSDGLSS